jgi:hypothetical protein
MAVFWVVVAPVERRLAGTRLCTGTYQKTVIFIHDMCSLVMFIAAAVSWAAIIRYCCLIVSPSLGR